MKRLLVILLSSIVACNNSDLKSKNTDTVTDSNDISQEGKKNSNGPNDRKTAESEKNDSTILITFPHDSTWVTVNGKMKGINHPITVFIPVKQGKRLTAIILPEDSTANIRINQIFTPSGKADGPFGKELKRSLHEQGTYKIILAENMMQGEEWKGNFKLTIRVER